MLNVLLQLRQLSPFPPPLLSLLSSGFEPSLWKNGLCTSSLHNGAHKEFAPARSY